jgi:hypothetical protein
MKKLLLPIVIILSLLLLVGCKDEYEPKKSTKEEARVVATVTVEGERYDIKYELYRALFLSNKSSVDGGDDSVWTGDGKGEYIDRINEIIFERAAEIYAVLSLGRELGIDAYSKEIDEQIRELVRVGVEGNGADIKGHGSYDKYLEALKKQGLNYSVHDLLYRYSIVLTKIEEYYKGTEDQALGRLPGDIEIKREDVKAYYESDRCARIFHIYFEDGKSIYPMSTYKAGLEAKSDDLSAALYIIQNAPHIVYSDLLLDEGVSGIMLGKYALDSRAYSEYTATAFSLTSGSVSDVITVTDGTKVNYLIYKLDKDSAHFERCFDTVLNSYIDNEIGRSVSTIKDSLLSSLTLKDAYGDISHKDVSMD